MQNDISVLLQLEHKCRTCQTYEELKYIIVNETKKLISYEHAIFLVPNLNGKLKVELISDISIVDSTSMFVQNIEAIANKSLEKYSNKITLIDDNVDTYHIKELNEYSKFYKYWIPINIEIDNIKLSYYLILFRKEILTQNQNQILSHLTISYGHFLFALRKCSLKTKIKNSAFKSKYFKYIAGLVFLLMFVPVKLTVLAPLEVVPKDPFIITSPLDGAIKSINTKPNQAIKKEELLVELEDIELNNKYMIAQKSLNVTQAQLFTAQQGSFLDKEQKNMILQLQSQVNLKQAELQYIKSQLDKTKIYASKEGVAIIQNPNEWVGKPVVTGERILLIANEKSVELKIMLPVSESIFIRNNAPIKAFFDNDPLNSWNAKIKNITYKPTITQQGELSYEINADFVDNKNKLYTPTIGLRGTAKIYSDEVSLFFYLFRKPITTLRQFVGW